MISIDSKDNQMKDETSLEFHYRLDWNLRNRIILNLNEQSRLLFENSSPLKNQLIESNLDLCADIVKLPIISSLNETIIDQALPSLRLHWKLKNEIVANISKHQVILSLDSIPKNDKLALIEENKQLVKQLMNLELASNDLDEFGSISSSFSALNVFDPVEESIKELAVQTKIDDVKKIVNIFDSNESDSNESDSNESDSNEADSNEADSNEADSNEADLKKDVDLKKESNITADLKKGVLALRKTENYSATVMFLNFTRNFRPSHYTYSKSGFNFRPWDFSLLHHKWRVNVYNDKEHLKISLKCRKSLRRALLCQLNVHFRLICQVEAEDSIEVLNLNTQPKDIEFDRKHRYFVFWSRSWTYDNLVKGGFVKCNALRIEINLKAIDLTK